MTATLPNLKTLRLVEQAVDALRERILSGAFGEDGLLPTQGQLGAELGVSRSVVREAMQRLQSQRLIELSQGRPARIRPASPDALTDSLQLLVQRSETSLLDLAEVRLTLEADIAAWAAERIDAPGLEQLRAAVDRLAAADSTTAQVEADLEFHRILALATGNPLYLFLLDALAALLRASRLKTIGRGGAEPALAGHRAVLAAVQARDPAAARLAMQAHVRASLEDLRRDLAEDRR